MDLKCEACGVTVAAEAQFCSECGASPNGESALLQCMGCGIALIKDAKFCPSCGAAMGRSPYEGRKKPWYEKKISTRRIIIASIFLILGAVSLKSSIWFMWQGYSTNIFHSPILSMEIAVMPFFVLAFITIFLKVETIMLIASIFMIIGGGFAINHGSSLNRDPMAFWQYGPNPGGEAIIAGVLLVFAGIVFFALSFWKRHRRP